MTVEDRFERLQAELTEKHGEGENLFVAIYCNHCDATVFASDVNALVQKLGGWRLGGFGENDYCPVCVVDIALDNLRLLDK